MNQEYSHFYVPSLAWWSAGMRTRMLQNRKPIKIIFDTDFGPDYDDVGALAFLHAMADSGKIEMLATISSKKHELVGPAWMR